MQYNMSSSSVTIATSDASYELIKQHLQLNETKALKLDYDQLVKIISFLTSQTTNSLMLALDVAQLLIFQMQINDEELSKFTSDLKSIRENVDDIMSLTSESDTELKEYNFMVGVMYINTQPQNAFDKVIENINIYQATCIANSISEFGQSNDSSRRPGALQQSSARFMQNYSKSGKSGTILGSEKQPLLNAPSNQQKKSTCCRII